MAVESVEPLVSQGATIADWATVVAAAATTLAVVVAWWGVTKNIRNSRDLTKKSQTLSLIVRGEVTPMHEKAIAVLKAHPNDGDKSIARLAVDKGKLNEEDRESADALYELLNWYEYLSAGVRHDILSEEFLRNASYSTMQYIWQDAKLFIKGVRDRKDSDTFCEAFECLIDRWKEAGYDGKLPKA